MTALVSKWGNSLAIRIPNHVAEMLSIENGSEMEMVVEGQEIKLIPMKQRPTLEELLAKVTPENRHHEVDFGEAEGAELL
ncbi:AbrB/MazE/SpoVT family DNA-binding domain-containing protein [Thermoactinomyces sp. DSM 45892]|uniref:AbrB/MazE/SpoVT family DNA-binding domain-containing protein n=2 Tax=unclassified Thermoactinomyces TaxID=2634588 RepID=UPI000B87A92E|nr:AbrB/MazE/SpoVT family DNA-binding domain-containing protein [Thermoactinomyces sp. DSM 45892]